MLLSKSTTQNYLTTRQLSEKDETKFTTDDLIPMIWSPQKKRQNPS